MAERDSGTVVELERFRQNNAPAVQTPDMALTPPIYRAISEDGRVFYSFMPESTDPLLKGIKWDLIECLDPAVDTGWLMVRYFKDKEMGVAVWKDRFDTGLVDDAVMSTLLLTADAGCFILTHREAEPGAPDHLIIYVNENPDAESMDIPHRVHACCLYYIVQPDGEVTYDPSLLYPD